MYPTRYLYALILAVMACTTATVFTVQWATAPDSDPVSERAAHRVLEEAIIRQLEEAEVLAQSTEERYTEAAKWKYQFVPHFVRLANAMTFDFLADTTNDYDPDNTLVAAVQLLKDLENLAQETLRDNAEHTRLFGDEELPKYLLTLTPDISELLLLATDAVHQELGERKSTVLCLELATMLRARAIVEGVVYLYAGRSIIHDNYFPLIEPSTCGIMTNDTLSATVSVGTFAVSLHPANVKIIVDGDTLTVDDDGRARLTRVPTVPGEHTLSAKLIITNPLTGLQQESNSTFTYLAVQ